MSHTSLQDDVCSSKDRTPKPSKEESEVQLEGGGGRAGEGELSTKSEKPGAPMVTPRRLHVT